MARHVWFAICIAVFLPGIWSEKSRDWRILEMKLDLLRNEIPRLKLDIMDLRTELELERARTDDLTRTLNDREYDSGDSTGATNDATELHKQLNNQSVRIHELERSVDNLQQANAVEDNSKTAVKVMEKFAKSIKLAFKSEKLRLRNITDELNLKSNDVQQETVRDMNKTIQAIIGQVKELANSTRAKLTDLKLAVNADKLRPCCLSDSGGCHIPYVKNGRINGASNGDTVANGKRVSVTCKSKHSLRLGEVEVQSFQAECRLGDWFPAEFPTCQPARCNLTIMTGSNYWTEPSAGKYLPLTRDTGIDSGTTVYINCTDGYDLIRVPEQFNLGNRNKSVGCLQGDWTRIFTCERQRCSGERHDNVAVSRDGTILAQGDSVFVNDQVTVQCSAGFEPVDADQLMEYTATCNPGRTWSPPFPDCREKSCDLPSIEAGKLWARPNGEFTKFTSDVVSHGSAVFLNCTERHQLFSKATQFNTGTANGLFESLCQRGGWQPPFPSCMPKRCRVPVTDRMTLLYKRNGDIIGWDFVRHETQVTAECQEGYHLSRGTGGRREGFTNRCDTGQWVKDFPTCEPNEDAPKVQMSHSHTERAMRELDHVTFTCTWRASPAELVWKWYKDDQLIPGENRNIYEIRQLPREYHGSVISCEATNSVGSTKVEHTMSILYGPRFVRGTQRVTSRIHGRAELECETDGNPPAEVTWFRKGSNSPLQMGTTYVIPDVHDRHYGVYTCTATVRGFSAISRGIYLTPNDVKYTISVVTSNGWGEGTDANVYMEISGEAGSTDTLSLNRGNVVKRRNLFETGHTDNFIVDAVDVGTIRSMKIWHDAAQSNSNWYLESVTVQVKSKGQGYRFSVRKWLRESDGRSVSLQPTSSEVCEPFNTMAWKVYMYPDADAWKDLERMCHYMSEETCINTCESVADFLCKFVYYRADYRYCCMYPTAYKPRLFRKSDNKNYVYERSCRTI